MTYLDLSTLATIVILIVFALIIRFTRLYIDKKIAFGVLIGAFSAILVLLMTSDTKWGSVIALIIFIVLVTKIKKKQNNFFIL